MVDGNRWAVGGLLVSFRVGSISGCLGNCHAGSLSERQEEVGMVCCRCRSGCDGRVAPMERQLSLVFTGRDAISVGV